MRTKTLCTSQDIGYQWSLFLSKENVKLCLILSVKVRPVFQKRFPHLYKDSCTTLDGNGPIPSPMNMLAWLRVGAGESAMGSRVEQAMLGRQLG